MAKNKKEVTGATKPVKDKNKHGAEISFDDWPKEVKKLLEEIERSSTITPDDLKVVINT